MTCAIISASEERAIRCKNEYEPPYPEIKKKLHAKLMELCDLGYDQFYVNCEYGVPLWCAEIIIELRMRRSVALHIAMPYEEQSANWVEEFRNRFFGLHAQANSVTIISTAYRADCCQAADQYMIDRSELLLAVGRFANSLSGVQYAIQQGIPVQFMQLL